MKRSKAEFVLDTEGQKYFFKEGKVTILEELDKASNFIYYFFVPKEDTKFGIITVTSPVKYAHVIAKKRLEDTGEISSNERMWIYFKNKLSATETKIGYAIFPSAIISQLNTFYSSYPSGTVVWDIIGFLMGYIKSTSNDLSLVMFHVLNDIFVVVANGKEFLLFSRYSIFSKEVEALQETISIIYSDILNLEQEKGVKLKEILWMEGFGPFVGMEFPIFKDKKYKEIPTFEYEDESGKIWYSCIPYLLKSPCFDFALFGKEERWIFPLERRENLLCLFLIILIIAGGALGWWLNLEKQKELQHTILLDKKIEEYENRLENFSFPEIKENTRLLMSLFKNFDKAIRSPSYAYIWQLLARVKPKNLFLKAFDMRYKDEEMELDLKGEILLSPVSAQKEFFSFLKELKRKRFKVVDSNLKIESGLSSFELKLVYGYEKN